ncbi:MAG: GC-type dockerin domain-anchored protein [Phycisphaerales bacterium]|nr:GC-type dockerin domain-anchored protein [Phycisphaerales bacterium]
MTGIQSPRTAQRGGASGSGQRITTRVDIGGQVGQAVSCGDGVLNNNDFVVYIDYFFTANPRADMGSQGGAPGADGQFDNNDFVVFIDYFFSGCN